MMTEKSVQVAIRIRPLVPIEISKGCKDVLEVFSKVNQVKIKDTDKAYTYNYVFDTNTTQNEVYESAVQSMIQNLFNGYNLTILAYGQTGSGKTHTMGTCYTGEGELGVIPRAVTEMFNKIRDNFTYDYSVTVSFMELYQEVLYDLLTDKSREQCMLEIREDGNKGVLIPGLTEIPVEDSKSVLETLMRGSKSRATGATNMNAQSSRSHAIFTVNLSMQSKSDGNAKTAKFHFVDLAGSERPKKTGAVGTTFKEGVNINKGLLVLGNVISALGDEKQQHGYIPYRDSNLTRLLKDSLGGNSITLMIACVSPADYNIEETLSTLRYADRARKIQNKPIVNEDPRAAEVNRLKKTIQDLRLQIVGQGGPVISSEEICNLKEQNHQLQMKIRDLTLQLSSTLNTNTGLMEKIIILQTANENLHAKIEELKNEYNVTVGNISLGFDRNDTESIKKNLQRLQDIQKQFSEIDSEQKKTENEIHHHEQIVDLHSSQSNGQFSDELDISKDQENYTNQQMALNNELQEVTKKLALKEHLARQIAINTQYMVDYKAIAEHEEKILQLQKEKDELMQQLKNAHSQGAAGKIAEQRRKRVQELESQIQDLNKKVQGQARLIKLKERDEMKINQLNKEILQMKQARVQLIKKIREETERFRTWKIQRERELAKLKQQDRKKQNQIVKMEAMHSKQQNVLKRKVEEAVALNKRLKDALALRKMTQETKNHEKNERIGHWIKQEVEVHLHLIEAEATLTGLLEDRATLQQQLDKLKDDPEADKEQIQSIEEDIELRSTQIQDLQQKILDSDDDNRKSKLENIQTMAEAKFAMKTILEQTSEIKRNEVAIKAKLIEAQASHNELTEKSQKLERIAKLLEYKHAEDISHLQKDYEEKIAVLLRQLRGVEVSDGNEEMKQRCTIQTEQIAELDKKNQELMEQLFERQKQVEELTQKIEKITEMAKAESKSIPIEEMRTPENKSRTVKIKQEIDSTFIVANQENINSSIEEETDDIEKDPDWKKTPLGKWILERRKRISQRNSSATSLRLPLKRTSDGGCMCVKSNCSKRCGCRKLGQLCTPGCKCSSATCSNRHSEEDSQDTDCSTEDKKPRLLVERNVRLFPND